MFLQLAKIVTCKLNFFYHKYTHVILKYPNTLICLHNADQNTVTNYLSWEWNLSKDSTKNFFFHFLENIVIMWTIRCWLIHMASFFLSRNIHSSKDPDSQMWSIYFCDLIVYDSQVKQKLFSESTPVSQSLSMNAPVDICCK